MTKQSEVKQFNRVDVLARIVAPFGSALIAVTQFPGTEIGNWFLIAVIVLGLFISVNQSLELLDRRLNPELHEEGVVL